MINIKLDGRIPSKKNSRITQRSTGRSFPSKDYTDWHKIATLQLMQQKAPRDKITVSRVNLLFTFGDMRRCDLTNKAESVMDLLVDYGVLKDDSWQCTGEVVFTPALSETKEFKCEIELCEIPY